MYFIIYILRPSTLFYRFAEYYPHIEQYRMYPVAVEMWN